jgi:hypothetical protein
MLYLSLLLLAALMLITGPLDAAPGKARVEKLAQPCRARNVLAGRVVRDRATGRDLLMLTNMNETTGCELVVIDIEKGTGRVIHAPKGAGSWALSEVPGDRMVVGTFYDAQFMLFDLKTMAFTRSVGVPGESYIWNLAMGSDGRIYGGTYGKGKLAALNLKTLQVEDLGAPSPPNLYLRYVSPTPGGRIVCYFSTEKPGNLIYNPADRTFSAPPAGLETDSSGVSWNGYFLAGSKAFHGPDLKPVHPLPFPEPPAERGSWNVDTYVTTPETLILRQGKAVWRYREGDEKLTLISDFDLRARILAEDSKGRLLGVRGQDWFILNPGDTALKLTPIPAESGPRPTMFLRIAPDGVIWGGPHFGQTLFSLDPETRTYINTSTVCDAGGEVYDVCFHKGCVYAAAYAGGDIVRYDPGQPWDQWNNKNPVTITHLGSRGYIRPIAGIRVGPDGMLYSGWMAQYGKYGGAIAVTDPETGKTELIENPLAEQAISGVAVDDRFIYCGTSMGANGLPNKKGELARFGIIDRSTRKVLKSEELQGATNASAFVLDAKTKMLAMTVNGKLRLFDTAKQEFVKQDEIPVSVQTLSAADGALYWASGKTLRTMDLQTHKAEPVAELPDDITAAAIGRGMLGVACGPDVYAVYLPKP